MPSFEATPIDHLRGVGPQRAELLRSELDIATFGDLLRHFPFRHVDRSIFHAVSEAKEDEQVQLRGVISGVKTVGEKQARRLVATLRDATGRIELVWFKGIRWLQPILKEGQEFIVYGKVSRFRERLNIAHPEIENAASWEAGIDATMQPVYATTEKAAARGLNSRGIARLTETLLQHSGLHLPETLSSGLVAMLGGLSREQAFRHVHAPADQRRLDIATRRLKFEELFFIQLQLLRQKQILQQSVKGQRFEHVGDLLNGFYADHLPFALTGAQKRVVKEIRKDMGSGRQMNRLLQGDVGSGKTLVALLSMLIALDNGFQAALMAPTEILAQQHFDTLSSFLRDMTVRIRLLTGSTKSAERRSIINALNAGEIHILVGTHALVEDPVRFDRLGLVVIDEQHRFGVAQRAQLWKKSDPPPHVLVMTATPIPRTLAMTLYGDLDVSVIDEMPPGRKPVKTVHRTDAARNAMFGFLEQEIAHGRQVYVVYPLIEESKKLDLKHVMDGYESITRRFPLPRYAVSIVHGQMPPDAKEYEMGRFKNGETNILVSTTVIEVGVDVPNASVMVIENAERFGLSQLHQLRGRVGRGADQSYCILMTSEKLGPDARTRMETMVSTTDGFKISEVDLRLRGPGDILGTQQSGLPRLHIADLVRDVELLGLARQSVQQLLAADPMLAHPENAPIVAALHGLAKGEPVWGRIG